jgi:hypothetical protein
MSWLLTPLAAYPDLIVSIWDNSKGNPTAADLESYDVVIFGVGFDEDWMYAVLDPTAIGDALADYLDAGGKVIETQRIQDGVFGGRYITDGYSAFTTSVNYYEDWIPFVVEDPTHPMMAGVTDLWCWSHLTPGLADGAVLLATTSGYGTPAIATKDNVVAIDMAVYNAVWGKTWDGQLDLLLHNAITWLSGETALNVPWLAEYPITSTLNPDSSSLVNITFTTLPTMTVGDEYTAWIILISGDANSPKIKIPVTMHVVGPTIYMPVIWKKE